MKGYYLRKWLLNSSACACLLACAPADAQIVPDATLPVNSSVTPFGNTSVISGGTIAGGNLFHSFQEFSIPTGSAASFNNALDIQNIISRVTGGNISNIDGLIRANGTANVFLINPNGTIFGSSASLAIGGSFVASTASSVKFADGTQFSATAPQATPLLTISVPIGLQFGQNPGSIEVQGTGYDLSIPIPLFSPIIRGSSETGLRVPQGKTLALVGGDVDIEGGVLTAEQGRIELGSVGSDGQVSLSAIPQGFTLSYQGVQRFLDIWLSQQASSDASGGGSIQVVGKRVSLTDGSEFLIQNQGVQQGGSISVNAEESFEVSGTNPDARIQGGLESEAVGGGSGADIAIKTRQLVIQGGAVIGTRSRSPGKGGNVTVNAADSVQVIGFSPINPTFATSIYATAFSSGDAGDVTVSTGRLSVLNGAYMVSATLGTGSGGDVTVNASESVELIGFEPSLFSPSLLSASTFNAADAGSLTINTSRLTLRDGGRVDASTGASGDAGSVTINASESVEVRGTVPGSRNPSLVISSANILDETLQQVFRLPPVPSGASGDVTINTARLSVTDGALVNVRNEGSGNAGTLQVNARSIFLDNQGGITAATASGVGGNISLEAQDLLARGGSAITATADGTGNGGNITIDTDTLVALENSDITANAKQSFGGRVRINAQGIFGTEFRDTPTPESEITATGGSPEYSGTVEINNPDVDPTQGLATLPAEFVDASNSFATGCAGGGENEFIITGRGGLPPNPYEPLDSSEVWRDVQLPRELAENSDGVSRTSTSPTVTIGRIVEATGWIVNENGKVELVALVPTAISQERCDLRS